MQTDVIYLGDCVKVLGSLPDNSVAAVITDPPFNIGLKGYDVYKDKLTPDSYVSWCASWLKECHRVLSPNGAIMVMISDEFAAEMNILLKNQGFHFRNWITWAYTFGQNQRKKFSRCHTHIHYFVKDADNFIFNADDIRIPSKRQTQYKDKRANPLGTVPADTWTIPSDYWDDIPRLCGTYKARIKKDDGSAHPCQLPDAIADRMIKAVSNPGDVVLDLFCGTGTFAASASRLNRKFITCDLSEEYARVAAHRIFGDDQRIVSL